MSDETRSLSLRDPLVCALVQLVIDANRLCDRQLGGTYEDDCRRSIDIARAALRAQEPPQAQLVKAASDPCSVLGHVYTTSGGREPQPGVSECRRCNAVLGDTPVSAERST